MSEEINDRVESMLLGESEQDTGEQFVPPSSATLTNCGIPDFMAEARRYWNHVADWRPVTIGTSTEPLAPERIDELMSKQRIRVVPAPSQLTDEIRAFIREEVHRTLYPAAEMANPHEHMRVELTTEKGKRWGGVLYVLEKESE